MIRPLARGIAVMVQINNPDNGNPSDRCGGIVIPNFIEIDPVVLPEPRYSMGADWFSIHRKRVLFTHHQAWVGNWCWDSLRMFETDAAELLAHCLKQRAGDHPVWSIQAATGDRAIELADKLRDGRPVSAEEFFVAIAEEKPEAQESPHA